MGGADSIEALHLCQRSTSADKERHLFDGQHIAGQSQHYLGAADQTLNAHRFVGPVREVEHGVVVRMGAGKAVRYSAQGAGKRESVKPLLIAGTHWISARANACSVTRRRLDDRSDSKGDELGRAM